MFLRSAAIIDEALSELSQGNSKATHFLNSIFINSSKDCFYSFGVWLLGSSQRFLNLKVEASVAIIIKCRWHFKSSRNMTATKTS